MTLSFKSLGLSEAGVHQLEKLGFTAPTTIQVQAIPELLAGRDVVGQSQTGTGKTAAFSLPIVDRIDTEHRVLQALILTPTRELAQQVADAIGDFTSNRRLGILTVYGGQSMERQIRELKRGVHMVVGTPGRVLDLLDRGDLKLDSVRWVVLDEADEMLSMGFIDDVKKILDKAPVERQTACFSATMPPAIRDLVNKFLKSPVTVTVEQPKAAPTRIDQRAYIVPRGWTKAKSLLPILELEDPESSIIFVRTRKSAAELTSQLQAAGHSVDEYHGDLSQSQRERLLTRFRAGQVRWVVATDIAARGLDVDHLTHVINYDLPDQVENYIHRIGRTGRAGKTGTAITVIQSFERRKLHLIERKVRQTLEVSRIPTRSQIEAHRLEKLQGKLREALAGERMASFLPVVRDLSEEYDPLAIAAAALQMVYDQTQPAWTAPDFEPSGEESVERPKLIKRRSDKPQASRSDKPQASRSDKPQLPRSDKPQTSVTPNRSR